ncbi:MAG: LysM peptidoglycan-binding domain-containing protein [Treponema sp.]|nr:LysM peptidoglycan-binding domain-containing protein [Treponema sp.]
MDSTIGIKIANGEFYSIVDENSQMKKRLVLTTVHDNQKSVQIDLYRSTSKTMADAHCIGSLVMDNINPKPKGEPSIELVISSSQNGDITADAMDLDTATKADNQSMTVSLKALDEDSSGVELPDFDLDEGVSSPEDVQDKTVEEDAGADAEADEEADEEKKRFPLVVIVCSALILTAIALAVWIFFFQGGATLENAAMRVRQALPGRKTERTAQAPSNSAPSEQPAAQPTTQQPPPEPAAQQQPVVQPAAQPEAAVQPATQPAAATQPAQVQQPAAQQPPVIQAPAQVPARTTTSRERPPAPVSSFDVPSVIPRDGVQYNVRYGDTLWDIAAAFYRDPWLYPRIARFNNIRNPDLIIAGTTIRVPPRN